VAAVVEAAADEVEGEEEARRGGVGEAPDERSDRREEGVGDGQGGMMRGEAVLVEVGS